MLIYSLFPQLDTEDLISEMEDGQAVTAAELRDLSGRVLPADRYIQVKLIPAA